MRDRDIVFPDRVADPPTPPAAVTAATAGSAPSATPPTLTITRQALGGVSRVRAGLVGANHRFLRDADGAIAAPGVIDQATVAMARDIGLESLRYPGGQVGNLFDHRRFAAEDPADRCQTSGGFQFPTFDEIPPNKSSYSPEVNADFVDQVGGRTVLAAPMANTSPAVVADLVRTVKQLSGQQTLFVEFGNEPYFVLERYWMSADPKRRLQQYIHGGRQEQPAGSAEYAGNQGLFPVTGCDLLHPTRADGTPGQTYRPRFPPVSLAGKPPVVRVAGTSWRYVPRLADVGPRARVFTLSGDRMRVRFGDGVHGRVPAGNMRLRYTSGPHPGFVDYYRRLSKIDGVRVCSAWGRIDFVKAMGSRRYDCLAVHSYSLGAQMPTAGAATTFRWLMRTGDDLSAELLALKRAMRSAPAAAASGRSLLVTEYGSLNAVYPDLGTSFLNDLFLARLLVGQVRAGVRVGTMPNLGKMSVSFPGGGRALSSRARVLQLFHHLVGHRPVSVTAPGSSGLVILAARKGTTSQLLVLNARTGKSGGYRPRLKVQGQRGTRCVTVRRMAAGLASHNVPTEAGGLPPSASVSSRTWPAGAGYRASFPAHSLTLVSISRSDDGSCPGEASWRIAES